MRGQASVVSPCCPRPPAVGPHHHLDLGPQPLCLATDAADDQDAGELRFSTESEIRVDGGLAAGCFKPSLERSDERA
jgi:hypothetical protein